MTTPIHSEMHTGVRNRRTLRVLALSALAALLLSPLPAARAESDPLRALARCIAESGAAFYGAHWCPYCHKQHEAFGDAAALLPYVECYEPGTRDRNDACEGVGAFPTWTFPNGVVLKGVQTPETLAALTDCES